MAISYPLTLPTVTGFRTQELQPETIVGMNMSQWTGAQQVQRWPGQWLAFDVTLPAMSLAAAGEWEAFFMALNGREGTFYLGPSVRKSPLGTAAGSWLVGASAVANSTTLPLKSGTGVLAKGDWLQIGTGSSAQLKRVLQVNLDGGGAMVSVDVFPRLRSAHAEVCRGMSFRAFESIS
jgi:hypothetical protein